MMAMNQMPAGPSFSGVLKCHAEPTALVREIFEVFLPGYTKSSTFSVKITGLGRQCLVHTCNKLDTHNKLNLRRNSWSSALAFV